MNTLILRWRRCWGALGGHLSAGRRGHGGAREGRGAGARAREPSASPLSAVTHMCVLSAGGGWGLGGAHHYNTHHTPHNTHTTLHTTHHTTHYTPHYTQHTTHYRSWPRASECRGEDVTLAIEQVSTRVVSQTAKRIRDRKLTARVSSASSASCLLKSW